MTAVTPGVRVMLRHRPDAEPFYDNDVTPTSPPGCVADKARWTLAGDPFDIVFWKLTG